MSTNRDPALSARLRGAIARGRARRTRSGVPRGPVPRRFGDAYRWPDGTWTQSG